MDDVTPGRLVNVPDMRTWLMVAAVGLQYYHTCCILLASANRHWGTVSNFGLARQQRIEEVSRLTLCCSLYSICQDLDVFRAQSPLTSSRSSDYPHLMRLWRTPTSWPATYLFDVSMLSPFLPPANSLRWLLPSQSHRAAGVCGLSGSSREGGRVADVMGHPRTERPVARATNLGWLGERRLKRFTVRDGIDYQGCRVYVGFPYVLRGYMAWH